MLSCYCPDFDDTNHSSWSYYPSIDFKIFDKTRRKRCCSCHELIDLQSLCLEFGRSRSIHTEVEEKIYGEDGEVPLADWYMCEDCGEIYLNLDALGFCVDISLDMREELKEYQQEYAGERWTKFKEDCAA
jgi:hypothetical protein